VRRVVHLKCCTISVLLLLGNAALLDLGCRRPQRIRFKKALSSKSLPMTFMVLRGTVTVMAKDMMKLIGNMLCTINRRTVIKLIRNYLLYCLLTISIIPFSLSNQVKCNISAMSGRPSLSSVVRRRVPSQPKLLPSHLRFLQTLVQGLIRFDCLTYQARLLGGLAITTLTAPLTRPVLGAFFHFRCEIRLIPFTSSN
jgi:hypothetical protein